MFLRLLKHFHLGHYRFGATAGLGLLMLIVAGAASLMGTQSASAQGYTVCANGEVSYSGQGCSGLGSSYCSGAYVQPNQYCCPNGTVASVGYSGYTGAGCPSAGVQYCPTAYPTPSNCLGGGVPVTYAAGWNIVAGPAGTTISGSSSPLYSFPAGANGYDVLPNGSAVQAGSGYWAYFPTSTAVSLPATSSATATVSLPPNQFVLIGNPSDSTATVSGAGAIVLTYSPTSGGYSQTTQLAPGQGAWAISPTGGQITIAGTFSPGLPPGLPF